MCWEVEPLERSRRGLDERVALAAPGLRRRLILSAMDEPAGSGRRRKLLTRAVRTSVAANNRNDYESVVAGYHPDAELIPPEPDNTAIGLEPVYRGPAGVRDFFIAWKSGFGTHHYEAREVADAGGRHTAIRFSATGTIGDSDTEITSELAAVISLGEHGLIIRHENFRSWEAALDALRRTASSQSPLEAGEPEG